MDLVRKAIKQKILDNKSKFFTVEFVKKDGSIRTLTGQHYESPQHQGVNPTAHLDKYVTVIERKEGTAEQRYKNINVETIQRLTIGGHTYTIK